MHSERHGFLGSRVAGFTLIEVLIAISILTLLAGIAIPMIGRARRNGERRAARAYIARIALAVDQYASDFGDFPGTRLIEIGLQGNHVNEGIESLVRCLTTNAKGGPYIEPHDDELINSDDDALATVVANSALPSPNNYELADPWGNPYIYFHHRDYLGGAEVETYLVGGKRIRCLPQPSAKMGTYPQPGRFLIWSIGPDGLNENGAGDDVCSWK